jgi:5-methylcytosine-specific restriction endonuclease McrA
MAVFVLGKHKEPLMPCSEKQGRLLLKRGRARVHKMYPFTIRLVDRESGKAQPLALKLDPGSKQTGIALVREAGTSAVVISLIELKHRGAAIRKALQQRAGFRRRRRSANLRYRAPRFDNRRRPEGWLAPSLQHRVDTVLATVARFRASAPITSIVQELVRFDMQLMENPEISGVEYQQGTLVGCEVREYLLMKWGRKCTYCDAEKVPLNIDHVHPRSRGGSDRVSNLVPACVPCNESKDDRPVEEFLSHAPDRLAKIKKQLKAPLKDAAAVNATRWALYRALAETGLPVSTGSGGRTKFNRHRFSIPKAHALDAVCTGNMDLIAAVLSWQQPTLLISANGRGSYKRTRHTAHGFLRGYLMRSKSVYGFTTGDMVRAEVLTGKKQGSYIARVAVRATGFFNLQTASGVVQGISYKHCRLLQRGDGYGYQLQKSLKGTAGKEERARGLAPATLSLPGLNAGVSRVI